MFGRTIKTSSRRFPTKETCGLVSSQDKLLRLWRETSWLPEQGAVPGIVSTRQLQLANAESALFDAALERVATTRMSFNNHVCQDVLKMARGMMLGEVECHKGNYKAAFAHFD